MKFLGYSELVQYAKCVKPISSLGFWLLAVYRILEVTIVLKFYDRLLKR